MTRVDAMTFALQRADLLRAQAAAVDFDPHLHGTYSVVVVLAGSAHIWSSRWSRTVQAGDVFFFNPFEVHAGRSTGPSARYHVLYPSETFLDSCTGAIPPDRIRTIRTDVLARWRAAAPPMTWPKRWPGRSSTTRQSSKPSGSCCGNATSRWSRRPLPRGPSRERPAS